MSNPHPDFKKWQDLLMLLETGKLKIPKFQREFIWKPDKTGKLLDSIVRGFPIGTFILWKSDTPLAAVKELAGVKFPKTPDGESVFYILDGQQRLASLFVSIKGEKITDPNNPKNLIDYGKFYVNLEKDPMSAYDESLVTFEPPTSGEKSITIYDLLNQPFTFFTKQYDQKYHNRIVEYQNKFNTYEFSIIEIVNADLEKAVEIFNRINTTGKALTTFEIMVALTYSEKPPFDLLEKYDALQTDLNKIEYALDDEGKVIIQTISVFLKGNCKRSTIISLNKLDVSHIWDNVVKAIKEAISYFQTELKIPVHKLLPYPVLVLPFAYFYYKNGFKPPNKKQIEFLNKYFWKCSFSERFSSAVETNIYEDIPKIDDIVKNQSPTYGAGYKLILTNDDLKSLKFTTGRSVCKAILSILASKGPTSFRTGTAVRLDNSWLTNSNSKNYHHFFPKDFLKKRGMKNPNVISNITFQGGHDNKKEIRTKAPSQYIGSFQKTNKNLAKEMKANHLIGDLKDFGILSDNYAKFIKKRTDLIYQEINSRIN